MTWQSQRPRCSGEAGSLTRAASKCAAPIGLGCGVGRAFAAATYG